MNSKPSDFSKSFKSFLGTKKQSIGRDFIKIDINGEIESDQNVVAEELSEYFSTVADDIRGSNTLSLSEDDFSSHPSVVNIANNFRSTEKFSLCIITKKETVKALESLNPPTKSMGYDTVRTRV